MTFSQRAFDFEDLDPPARRESSKLFANQANYTSTPIIWSNLKFRSRSEVAVAKALDRAGVLFFPNCVCRISEGTARLNREPDFLVFFNGGFGILEVDGEPFHPAERAALDHRRDRLFRRLSIPVERFDAGECYQNPDLVVRQFLEIISGGWKND